MGEKQKRGTTLRDSHIGPVSQRGSGLCWSGWQSEREPAQATNGKAARGCSPWGCPPPPPALTRSRAGAALQRVARLELEGGQATVKPELSSESHCGQTELPRRLAEPPRLRCLWPRLAPSDSEDASLAVWRQRDAMPSRVMRADATQKLASTPIGSTPAAAWDGRGQQPDQRLKIHPQR